MVNLVEDNGAIEVDEATEVPLIVFIGGPIKYWWGKKPDGTPLWGSEEHLEYAAWRDDVRRAIVATGRCVTFCPHRALQGAWHPALQKINNAALMVSDIVLVLTPDGIPAWGTEEEALTAERAGIRVLRCPPGRPSDLEFMISVLLQYQQMGVRKP